MSAYLSAHLAGHLQEILALGVVGLVAGKIAWGLFQSACAEPLARFLLKRGKVKWAMRLRSVGCKNGCA